MKDTIREKIIDGTLKILVSNNLGGDPAPGTGKQLVVIYRYDGQSYTQIVSEKQTLSLP